MKTTHLLCGALASAFLFVPSARAADLRWVGLDITAASLAPGQALKTDHAAFAVTAVGGTTTGSVSSLAALPFGAGANIAPLFGSLTTVSGLSSADTVWNIDAPTDTLTLTLNHSVAGAASGSNFAGAEGVLYFYALTAGVFSVTYDYGMEQTDDPTAPYKASERGRSKVRTFNNSRGLGDDAPGLEEIVNRDGSRTLNYNVGPGSDLIGLQFDFGIDGSDPLFPTGISGGYLNASFTPAPEPGTAALLGTAALGLLARRRRVG